MPSTKFDFYVDNFNCKIFLLLFPLILSVAPFLWAQEIESTIHLIEQSQNATGKRRESALNQLKKIDHELVLIDALSGTNDPKDVERIVRNLFNLNFPNPASNNGNIYYQLRAPCRLRNLETRPRMTGNSKKLRKILIRQLELGVLRYDSYGELDPFDKSAENRKRIDLQGKTRIAIGEIKDCLTEVGQLSDIENLVKLLNRAKAPACVLVVTHCIQAIYGDTPDVFYNDDCGTALQKNEFERKKKEERLFAAKVKTNVLDFLKTTDLKRDLMMRHFANNHFEALKRTKTLYNCIYFGATSYNANLNRCGIDMIEFLAQNYDVKNGGSVQANFEALRASATGEYDEPFVKKLLDGRVKFIGSQMIAVEIIASAGTKKHKDELISLCRFVPKKNRDELTDYETEYNLALRKRAAEVLAICHGKSVLKELKSIKKIPMELGYSDSMYWLVKELEAMK